MCQLQTWVTNETNTSRRLDTISGRKKYLNMCICVDVCICLHYVKKSLQICLPKKKKFSPRILNVYFVFFFVLGFVFCFDILMARISIAKKHILTNDKGMNSKWHTYFSSEK